MSKNILIVESDSALSHSMRAELETRGFSVQETSDGKGSVELIRKTKPDLVVMEVELSAGQNGYILCGKLKKDDDLKSIPIVIVGNQDGFAQHKKLKTRADDYVAKPVDMDGLSQAVGNLIGFPETSSSEVVEDEDLNLSELVEEVEATGEFAAEEIAVDTEEEATMGGDPELDMLDAAFEDATDAPPPAPVADDDDAFSALDGLDGTGGAPAPIAFGDHDEEEDRTIVGFVPETDEPKPAQARAAPSGGGVDMAEVHALKARVNELESSLADSRERAGDAEEKVRALEEQVASLTTDVETARASAQGSSNKEVFALRDAANKKDKEILRLKSELNEKDNEIVELRDKVLQLEQQMSESSGEMAKKDAQLKTLTQKAEQLQGERKKFDQQLLQAKEEARTANANLTALQSEMEDVRSQLTNAHSELDELRTKAGDLESDLRTSRDEGDELRREVESLRDSSSSARREADDLRSQLEQTQIDLDSAKNQLTAQATAFAEEASSLRRRITELEEQGQKNEERISKFYSKIKDDEKIREKTRKALAIAMQLLDEQQQQAAIEIDVDDAAEA